MTERLSDEEIARIRARAECMTWARDQEAADDITALLAEIDRLRAATMCDGCTGTGTALSGACGCGGTGRLIDMLAYVRGQLHRAEVEVVRLKFMEYDQRARFARDLTKVERDRDEARVELDRLRRIEAAAREVIGGRLCECDFDALRAALDGDGGERG